MIDPPWINAWLYANCRVNNVIKVRNIGFISVKKRRELPPF
jgi:hypothetical protein